MIRAADQRASDADREEVVELLRIAAGEGRIAHDELDERLTRALSAKTYRQLHATVDDIPRDRGASNRRLPQAQRTVASGPSDRSATSRGCSCSCCRCW